MMVDTNIIIFLVREPKRIPAHVMARLKDPDEYRCASIVSFWEIAIKHRKGKLPMPSPFAEAPADTFAQWCERAVIELLPLAPRHIERALRLTWTHDDPFDRLIAATALSEDSELVTSDKRFTSCPGLRAIAV